MTSFTFRRSAVAAVVAILTSGLGTAVSAADYLVLSPTPIAQRTIAYYPPAVVAAPVTTYYAPAPAIVAAPRVTYYTPAPVVTAAPVTTYYSTTAVATPVTTYYSSTAVAAPVTTYYAPAAVYAPVTYYPAGIVRSKVYYPGQPVRNCVLAATP